MDQIEREKRLAYEQIGNLNQCARPMTTEERLNHIFKYQDDPRKIPNYIAIRTAAKHLAEVITQNSPTSVDQTTAIRCVREAVMWANAAVALDGINF